MLPQDRDGARDDVRCLLHNDPAGAGFAGADREFLMPENEAVLLVRDAWVEIPADLILIGKVRAKRSNRL